MYFHYGKPGFPSVVTFVIYLMESQWNCAGITEDLSYIQIKAEKEWIEREYLYE